MLYFRRETQFPFAALEIKINIHVSYCIGANCYTNSRGTCQASLRLCSITGSEIGKREVRRSSLPVSCRLRHFVKILSREEGVVARPLRVLKMNWPRQWMKRVRRVLCRPKFSARKIPSRGKRKEKKEEAHKKVPRGGSTA